MRSSMYMAWLATLLQCQVAAAAAPSSMCSTVGAADPAGSSNIFQSRSACADKCKGSSAYAVVQYDQCWCTNQTPGSTVDDGKCNKPCPGYPIEMCGGDGQFTYILLDKSKAQAGAAASSARPPPESSQAQPPSNPPPSIVTIIKTTTRDSKTIIQTQIADTSLPPPPPSSSSASSAGKDEPATVRTITVTGSQVRVTSTTSASASPAAVTAIWSGSSGLRNGVITGVAVGASAAVVILGLAAFLVWRKKKSRGDGNRESRGSDSMLYFAQTPGATAARGARTSTIKRHSTRASSDSRMGAFGSTTQMWRNSTGSLEDSFSESNQVLRVVNPDVPEKM